MVITWKHVLVGVGLIGLGYLAHESLMTNQMRGEIASMEKLDDFLDDIMEELKWKIEDANVDDIVSAPLKIV